ncbi:Calcium-transporting ATPase 1, putative [Babesia ovata]|uniref:Calcium-transporting ATPase 1, putative n=1 Tax=Babesia ovata TaxID=189622 RepID=A0A2H6KGN4_9APIC|nr:Calcium-transporting ATPase 1, putative [Babesia ovata]GBE62129.1 Calcium-transporting ATPase 1, putative [Babesia ovata]
MIILNDAAVGANGGPDNPDSNENAPKGIAFYANNEEFHQRLQRYIALLKDADQIHSNLSSISKSIPDSNVSPEVEEAKQRECGNLLTTFENIIHRAEYVELKSIFDIYAMITTRQQNKDVKQQRLHELDEKRVQLEKRFKDKEGFAAALINFDLAEAHKSIIDDAIAFIRRHNAQEPSQPPSKPAGSNSSVSGGEDVPLASNIPAETNPTGAASTPDHTNHMAAMGNANTRGGRGTTHDTNGENTSQTTEGTVNDIPNTADAKGSSGFATIGARVIQTMMALGVMAVL